MKKLIFLVSMLAAALLVFAASCITKEIPVTEVYVEIEYQPETYTSTEEYEVKTTKSSNLFQMQREVESDTFLFLFNRDKNGNIRWSPWTLSGGTEVNTFAPMTTGQNHRIAITGTNRNGVTVALYIGRDPAAIAKDFGALNVTPKPTSERVFKLVLMTHPELSPGYEMQAAGYQVPRTRHDPMGAAGVEYFFDEMFARDGWAMVEVNAYNANCYLTLSIDYLWDDVKIMTGEVTKTREVATEVQKERTVIKTQKVPFWEVLFSK